VGDRLETVGDAATCTVVTATARVVGTGLYNPQVRVWTGFRAVGRGFAVAARVSFACCAYWAVFANQRRHAVILTEAPLDAVPSTPLCCARALDVALIHRRTALLHRHCTGISWSMASVPAPTPWRSSRRWRRRCWRPSVRSSAWRASPRRRSTGVPTAWPPSCQAAQLRTRESAHRLDCCGFTLHSVVCVYFLFSRDALPRWYFAGTGETVLPPFSPRGSDRDAASPRVEKQPLVLWCGHGGRSHRAAIAQRASFHPVRPILSASVSVDPPRSNSTHFNLLNEIHSM